MNVEESDLRTGLHRLTDQPHPVNASVDTARAKGRRIIRWRRAGTVAGTAVAVGAVVLGTVAVLPGGEKATGNNIAGSSSSTARPNPYVQRASFGWLPQGYNRPVTTDFENGIFYVFALKRSAAAETQFSFSLFPAGPEPALGSMRGGVPAKAIPAPPVNGRPAHWMQPPPPGPGTAPGEARLRIQFAPKQWGELEYDAAPEATDLKAVLYKVARAIKIHDTPQNFPIQLKGLPVSFKPGNASVSTDPQGGIGWQTSVAFEPGLSIYVGLSGQADGPRKSAAGKPNITIDGHPASHRIGTFTGPAQSKRGAEDAARRSGKSLLPLGSERLCVYGVHGLDICYFTTAPANKLLKPSGGLVALYKRTTVFTPNPSTWTTNPLA